MNEIQTDLRRSIGYVAAPTVRKVIERSGSLVTQAQIETAGKAYVQASVWTAAAHALIDAARVVGRTLWKAATIAGIGLAGLWILKHLPAIIEWL